LKQMISNTMLIQLLFLVFSFLTPILCNSPVPPENNHKHSLKPLQVLPRELKECSGMAALGENIFVALNDDGNKPNLFVFSIDKANKTRIVKVAEVENNDWEELAVDEEYLYIGDTGNNDGMRRNLMIYRVRKDDVIKKDEVVPEKIEFSYEGQTKFNASNRNNFDCEAMVCVGDSIFLFTKNRGNFKTDLYGFPKTPGHYVVKKLASFDAIGLITGADYRGDHSGSELILVGYKVHWKSYQPFLIHFTNFTGTNFFSGESKRISFDQYLQTESVSFNNHHEVYLTNEETKRKAGFIYVVSILE